MPEHPKPTHPSRGAKIHNGRIARIAGIPNDGKVGNCASSADVLAKAGEGDARAATAVATAGVPGDGSSPGSLFFFLFCERLRGLALALDLALGSALGAALLAAIAASFTAWQCRNAHSAPRVHVPAKNLWHCGECQ